VFFRERKIYLTPLTTDVHAKYST